MVAFFTSVSPFPQAEDETSHRNAKIPVRIRSWREKPHRQSGAEGRESGEDFLSVQLLRFYMHEVLYIEFRSLLRNSPQIFIPVSVFGFKTPVGVA